MCRPDRFARISSNQNPAVEKEVPAGFVNEAPRWQLRKCHSLQPEQESSPQLFSRMMRSSTWKLFHTSKHSNCQIVTPKTDMGVIVKEHEIRLIFTVAPFSALPTRNFTTFITATFITYNGHLCEKTHCLAISLHPRHLNDSKMRSTVFYGACVVGQFPSEVVCRFIVQIVCEVTQILQREIAP